MKKIFTIAAALLASFSLMADELCSASLNGITSNSNTTGVAQTGCTMKWNSVTSSGSDVVTIGEISYYKMSGSSSYVQLILDGDAAFEDGDVLIVTACSNNNSGKNITYALKSDGGNKADAVNATNAAAVEVPYTLVAADIEEDGSIKIFRGGNSNIRFGSFKVTREVSTEPALRADKESMDLFVSPIVTNPSATVNFIGKNLTPGEHAITVPNLAGLTVTPASVTVGEDGKLNAEVTIAYASDVDVEAASTSVSLVIDEVEASVTINYGAISQLCGELIKATARQVVSGVIGGTVDTNLGAADAVKLDKKKYFGLVLAAGTFAEGDTLVIDITAAADLGNCMIYSDNAGTDLIYDEGITYTKADAEVPVICPTGLKKIVLPATINGKSSVYLYRQNDALHEWNVTFASLSVIRPCEEGPSTAIDNTEASVKAVKRIVNGQLFIEKNGVIYNAQGAIVK